MNQIPFTSSSSLFLPLVPHASCLMPSIVSRETSQNTNFTSLQHTRNNPALPHFPQIRSLPHPPQVHHLSSPPTIYFVKFLSSLHLCVFVVNLPHLDTKTCKNRVKTRSKPPQNTITPYKNYITFYQNSSKFRRI